MAPRSSLSVAAAADDEDHHHHHDVVMETTPLMGNHHYHHHHRPSSLSSSSFKTHQGLKNFLYGLLGVTLGMAFMALLMAHQEQHYYCGGGLYSPSSSSSSTTHRRPSSWWPFFQTKHHVHHHYHSKTDSSSTSRYTQVQGLGFQIYTGGAPAFLHHRAASKNGTTRYYPNPECIQADGSSSYGHNLEEDALQCYLGHSNPVVDVQQRLQIMQSAVQRAYELANPNPSILKVFIAPEFFWRGVQGAYVMFDDADDDDHDDTDDDDECGPICVLLKGLEQLVASPKYQDWLFVFGTVVASEVLLPVVVQDDDQQSSSSLDYLFYNFAPVYKGYDHASSTSFTGKRFLVPKRYVSSSDFLTPQRHMRDKQLVQELLDSTLSSNNPTFFLNSTHADDDARTTIRNPFDFEQKRYHTAMWIDYKHELTRLGYTMIEYDWLIMDQIAMTIEICFDHDRRTALNSYLADMVTADANTTTTWIPSSSSHSGLEYVPMPRHQAQISIVSSAGMTVTADSLALVNNGVIFLQDGLSNETGQHLVDVMPNNNNNDISQQSSCNTGEMEFVGGTEAVQRTAVLTPSDVYFEYKVLQDFGRHSVYPSNDDHDDDDDDEEEEWKKRLAGSFSVEKYEPMITVYEPVDIAKV